GLCGPGCCGGSYSAEGTVYFSPSGSLFGVSRVLLAAGIPIFPGLAVEAKLGVDAGGLSTLSLGWNLKF
ncbi:MAG: hypothetical protein NUV94_07035, partial [Candidatus Acetothermia bacterium]|nr:hypothetical protein [Candidatus Acetothermia bacterium]